MDFWVRTVLPNSPNKIGEKFSLKAPATRGTKGPIAIVGMILRRKGRTTVPSVIASPEANAQTKL